MSRSDALAIAHVSTLGDYYTVHTDHDDRDQPLHATCADRDDVGVRLKAVATALGTTELRVAASSTQYELAERLWSVLIATWSHHQLLVDPFGLWVGPTTESWRLTMPRSPGLRAGQGTPAQVATTIARAVLTPLATLHRTVRSHTSVAEGLLWGNAATAATLALRGIKDPVPRARAVTLVTELLTLAPLRHRLDGPVDGVITRRSCCLYYRTHDPRPCGDCPLASSTVTRLAAHARTSP